jgi:hypothetical protein
MSLNSEPAAPEERAELNLPPKTYADAAEEALEPAHANGVDGTVESTKQRLRTTMDDVANGFHHHDDSLEGVGLDASPKSPTAKGHRRKVSRGVHESIGRKHGELAGTELYEEHLNGHGEALISVKPRQDRDTIVSLKTSEFKSGRQAGAGWARSKYVGQTSSGHFHS